MCAVTLRVCDFVFVCSSFFADGGCGGAALLLLLLLLLLMYMYLYANTNRLQLWRLAQTLHA